MKITKTNYVVPILIIAAVIGLLATASADRDIVFAAQHYRWSGKYYVDKDSHSRPEKTLDDVDTYHLYRMNPDGKNAKQITFGNGNEFEPRWSPDGKTIAFIKADSNYGNKSLCIADERGQHQKSLFKFTNDTKFRWSPNGRQLGILIPDWADRANHIDRLCIIDIKTGHKQLLKYVTDFDWSPDCRKLALWYHFQEYEYERNVFKIVDVASNKVIRSEDYMSEPFWISNSRILGIELPREGTEESASLRFTDANGQSSEFEQMQYINNEGPTWSTRDEWRRVPLSGHDLICQSYWGMSDGGHYQCYVVNWFTKLVRYLAPGRCLGVSPDGKSILAADQDWIGPYKRGGRRCGPIKLINIKTGKSRTLTGKLMSVAGGDWRKPPAKTSR